MHTFNSFVKHSNNLKRLFVAVAVLCFGTVSCGGGDSSGGSSSSSSSAAWKSGVFADAGVYANKCLKPRTGIDPNTNKAFPDKTGTFLDENNFLRSWTNDTYLWFNEVTDRDPANYTTPDYFDLLKTTQLTASGKKKDQFHFTYDTAEWNKTSSGAASSGYGLQIAWISEDRVPRNLVIAFVEPNSPANSVGVKRGAKIISIDGADLINGVDSASVAKLNAGLFPAANGQSHEFEFQDPGASTTYKLTLVSADVTPKPVPLVKTIATSNGKVGYILFNDHIQTAELQLRDAVLQLNAEALTGTKIDDLVLDIRYNGGGYLYIASQLAYMIAGSSATAGKTFEKTTFNSKYQTKDFWGDTITPTPFKSTLSNSSTPLPTLSFSSNSPRVFVLTSGDTCSASEAVINGLRGVGVQVIQIGSKTCGKPYGFYPQDNCGTTYFSIQFKGVNDKGFGEYSDGFVPSDVDNNLDNIKGCSLGDDLTKPLGDPTEKNLATALNFRLTNSCTLPVAVSSPNGLQKTSFENELSDVHASLNKPEILMNRYLVK